VLEILWRDLSSSCSNLWSSSTRLIIESRFESRINSQSLYSWCPSRNVPVVLVRRCRILCCFCRRCLCRRVLPPPSLDEHRSSIIQLLTTLYWECTGDATNDETTNVSSSKKVAYDDLIIISFFLSSIIMYVMMKRVKLCVSWIFVVQEKKAF